MTIHIADIASYQNGITPDQLAAAGFTGINVKVSHGQGYKSVHPNVGWYVGQARNRGWWISSFHWLTKDMPGDVQARHAYARLFALDILDCRHVVDVEESGVTEEIWRSYVDTMEGLLPWPVITYSGDWYMASRPWLRPALLWSAPAAGYLPAGYPGDDSPHWEGIDVLQYRVAPIAGIAVSQSAAREGTLMPNSQNGWPVVTDDSRMDETPIHGVPIVNGVLRGDVATVLHYIARRFHDRVEPLFTPGCWGHNVRKIGNSNTWSNHSSGTAMDLNAPRHPQGVRNTFTPAQREEIRDMLEYLEGVVRWGGDYTGTPDDMHFEIDDTPAAVHRVAEKIERDGDMTPAEMTAWAKSAEGKAALCAAVFNTDNVIPAPAGGDPSNTHWGAASYLTNTYGATVNARTYAAEARTAAREAVALLQSTTAVDPQAVANALLPGLSAAIIAALPEGTLTISSVRAAMADVLLHGVASE
jgi:hypothetical protein